jgi:hypothetical protein
LFNNDNNNITITTTKHYSTNNNITITTTKHYSTNNITITITTTTNNKLEKHSHRLHIRTPTEVDTP